MMSFFSSKKETPKEPLPLIVAEDPKPQDQQQVVSFQDSLAKNADLVGGTRAIESAQDMGKADAFCISPTPSMKEGKRSTPREGLSEINTISQNSQSPRRRQQQQQISSGFANPKIESSTENANFVVTELSTEVESLTKALNSLQQLLVASQSAQEKCRLETVALRQHYESLISREKSNHDKDLLSL